MDKEENEDIKNCNIWWSCDNDCVDNDVKVGYYCQITEKFRGCAHTDYFLYRINLKLNHQSPVVFYIQKNYESHPIMQGLGKLSLKINIIPDELEKSLLSRR